MTDDPRATLLAKIRAARVHPYEALIDTPEGVRYVCKVCGPLTAEEWAGPCPVERSE